MKFRENSSLQSFSSFKEIECLVAEEREPILELPTDLFNFCKSKGIKSAEKIITYFETDAQAVAKAFGMSYDDVDEAALAIELEIEEFIYDPESESEEENYTPWQDREIDSPVDASDLEEFPEITEEEFD